MVKHKFVFKSSHESEKLKLIKAYFVLYSKVNRCFVHVISFGCDLLFSNSVYLSANCEQQIMCIFFLFLIFKVIFSGVYANMRMVHVLTSVVGTKCELEVKNGSVYEGVFKTYGPECDLVLDAAHRKSPEPTTGPRKEDIVESIIFKASDVVVVTFKDVDPNFARKDNFTDAAVTGRINGEHKEKDLEPWDGGDGHNSDSLESLDTDVSNGWDPNDMFKYNEEKYGVLSTYDSSLSTYTLPLERDNSEEFLKREARAAQLAEEIEASASYKARVALENDERTEEEKYTAVVRGDRETHTLENKYVPPGQRNREPLSWSTGRQNSPRLGQGSVGPSAPRPGPHDYSPNAGTDQRVVNGGPPRMSPKSQRTPRSHRVPPSRISGMPPGVDLISHNSPGEAPSGPPNRNNSSGGTWSSVVSGAHRPRSPRQNSMGGSSPGSSSLPSPQTEALTSASSPTTASPTPSMVTSPTGDGRIKVSKECRVQETRQTPPSANKDIIKSLDSSPSVNRGVCKGMCTSPKPANTPTPPRPQGQPSPSIVVPPPQTVYGQPVCFPQMYPLTPVSPGVQVRLVQMPHMTVSQSKPYRPGKVPNMGQQRSDQHHPPGTPTMMHPATAAGPQIVAPSQAYSAQYFTCSPQQFTSQPLVQQMPHYQSQAQHVFSPVMQGGTRMMAPPTHGQPSLVSSSTTQYHEQTHTMYVSAGPMPQQYPHPSATLHPHPQHPQQSATPTGQAQQGGPPQHGGPPNHPAASPVQHPQHQQAAALHMASQPQQQQMYSALAATPPSMTPGPNPQSPQASFPSAQQAVYIHPQQVQHGYNHSHIAHVQQAHMQSGMVPSHHPGPTHPPMMLMATQGPPGGPQGPMAQTALNPIPVSSTTHFSYLAHPQGRVNSYLLTQLL
uniref:Ataxin 2 n=1 Tax=Oryzias sinensis TaxID=183150 RepID=A0A8C7ZXD6_9TELE